jgi:hypothetical protein
MPPDFYIRCSECRNGATIRLKRSGHVASIHAGATVQAAVALMMSLMAASPMNSATRQHEKFVWDLPRWTREDKLQICVCDGSVHKRRSICVRPH